MQTLQETLEIFRNEALGAIYDSFLSFKTFVDNSSDRQKLIKMIDATKISLADELIIVHYPLKSGGQSQEVKDHIKTIDAVQLFKMYLDYYELTCKAYLDTKIPGN
ncbi:hypothetical protein [Chryseobacterium proteolyticum]|uniref:hypothetical protein n=1 Tax=Chryseobacterium proteolyticum TaxID=118127 RepID=UPI003983643B